MKSSKEKLISIINKLPDDSGELYVYDNFDLFPDTLRLITQNLNENYQKDLLLKMSQDKNTSLDFIFLINKIVKSLTPLNEWLHENQIIFDKSKLADNVKRELESLTQKMDNASKETAGINTQLESLKNLNSRLSKETDFLELKRNKYSNLLNNQEQLKERKTELEQLEKEIKEGKLEELEKENIVKGKKLSSSEEQRDKLLRRRDQILKKQKDLEVDTQKLIDQTVEIGNTEELFKELKQKCIHHNKKMLKIQRKESEALGINIKFTEETSNALFDNSLNEKIKQAKQLIDDVEQAMKQKIK